MNSTKQSSIIKTKNNQPVKSISYQDMYLIKDTFDQLESWTQSLMILKNFFSNKAIPLNKKQIIKEFHVNSQIFNIFYKDFLAKTAILEKQFDELKTKEKAKV
ncbi:hypothetical protein [Candidatus Enterococcus mansonii]|uniref:Uncharacterized protein n=1 Tax=Candidatus Enterococcus mansonii TaxID=1834181 RepID=A0A242CED1_9ENTE|nr:hypothetical protein [Enterococcus sp. 4G2_DIV0659]OTO08597.1 hypothetical protein A5880_001597 [Enterococcus sp. 4G2_DIV0659]